jgi:hypothetical protein
VKERELEPLIAVDVGSDKLDLSDADSNIWSRPNPSKDLEA